MSSFNFKKYLPHILVVAGLLVISLLYCYPALSGKELAQSDNLSWKGMSHEAQQEYERTGKPVLWSNSMFGGMPTYTYFVGSTNNYIGRIESTIQKVVPKPAYFFFLAMLCFYILMQVMRVNKWLAGIGAVAFAFATYNPVIIGVGHETKMLSIAYMPAVLAGMLLLYRGRWLGGMALMGISFALMFQNQHFQVIYYLGIIMFFMFCGLLYQAVKRKTIKQFVIATVLTGLTAALAVGPSLPVFLNTQEYAKMTMRGGESELTFNHDKGKTNGGLDKEYAFRWSNGIGETFCILVPGLYGGSNSEPAGAGSHTYEKLTGMGVPDESAEQFTAHLPLYWGPQPSLAGPVYFGAVICFLFVLGMLVIRSPHKWWIAAACLLGIVMSWGRHFPGFNYFLFDTLPYLNKFRTPSMVLVIPQVLFPIVAIWALNDIIREKVTGEELWKSVKVSLIATGGLCLVLAFGSRMIFTFRGQNDAPREQQFGQMLQSPESGKAVMNAIVEDRESMAMKSGLLSAFYIALAGGLLWAYSRKKIKKELLIAGIGILIAVDLIPEASRYLNEENYQEADQYAENFAPRPADQQILRDPDPYFRVLDVTRDVYNDAIQSYFHKTVGGYSPAKMEIYQDLIDVHLNGSFNGQVLNMLNTKYFIVPGGQGGTPGVMPNPEACGNAWFVNNIKWVNTADEEILSLKAPKIGDTVLAGPADFRPKETAVIRNTFKDKLNGFVPGKDSAAAVRLDKYGLNEISYASSNGKDGLAVFSDIWYPYGWKAYVDGKETPIIRVDYVLRAIRIPAGSHKIEFKFHPDKFYTGNTIALICSLLLYGLLIAGIVIAVRKGNDPRPVDSAPNA